MSSSPACAKSTLVPPAAMPDSSIPPTCRQSDSRCVTSDQGNTLPRESSMLEYLHVQLPTVSQCSQITYSLSQIVSNSLMADSHLSVCSCKTVLVPSLLRCISARVASNSTILARFLSQSACLSVACCSCPRLACHAESTCAVGASSDKYCTHYLKLRDQTVKVINFLWQRKPCRSVCFGYWVFLTAGIITCSA